MLPRLLVDSRHEDGVAVLVAIGELDLDTVAEIVAAGETELAIPGVWVLRLDLSQVPFIDSTGLGALVRLHNAAVHLDKSVILYKPQPQPLSVIALTGLDSMFVIDPPPGA